MILKGKDGRLQDVPDQQASYMMQNGFWSPVVAPGSTTGAPSQSMQEAQSIVQGTYKPASATQAQSPYQSNYGNFAQAFNDPNQNPEGTFKSPVLPYEYNQGAFKNPYLEQEQGNISSEQQRILGGGGSGQAQNLQNQGQFLNELQNRAMGNGPSVAQQQLQQGLQQNQAGIAAQIASSRNQNTGQALREGLMAQANAGTNMNAQAAQLRAQEMMGNQNSYMQGLQGQNQQYLQQQQITNPAMANLLAQQQNAYQNQFASNQGLQQLQGNQYLGAQQLGVNQNLAQQGINNQKTGSILSGLGALGVAGMGAFGAYQNNQAAQAENASTGGIIKGQSKIAGDSPKNDTIPIMASPGEIVIKKSSSGNFEDAVSFLRELFNKNDKTKKMWSGGCAYSDGGQVSPDISGSGGQEMNSILNQSMQQSYLQAYQQKMAENQPLPQIPIANKPQAGGGGGGPDVMGTLAGAAGLVAGFLNKGGRVPKRSGYGR